MVRWAICAVVAMLAGCGRAQPLTGAPGAISQSHAIAAHAERGGSWMLPDAKTGDLLYVSDIYNGIVDVYKYGKSRQVGAIHGFD